VMDARTRPLEQRLSVDITLCHKKMSSHARCPCGLGLKPPRTVLRKWVEVGGAQRDPPPKTATTVIAKGATTRRATEATAATHAALSQSPLSTTMAEAGGKTPAPLTERPFSKTQLFCSNLPWSVNGKVSHRPQAASHTQGARRESRA
jgi:hypothetical protein